jgi:hypothetical protein
MMTQQWQGLLAAYAAFTGRTVLTQGLDWF